MVWLAHVIECAIHDGLPAAVGNRIWVLNARENMIDWSCKTPSSSQIIASTNRSRRRISQVCNASLGRALTRAAAGNWPGITASPVIARYPRRCRGLDCARACGSEICRPSKGSFPSIWQEGTTCAGCGLAAVVVARLRKVPEANLCNTPVGYPRFAGTRVGGTPRRGTANRRARQERDRPGSARGSGLG